VAVPKKKKSKKNYYNILNNTVTKSSQNELTLKCPLAMSSRIQELKLSQPLPFIPTLG
tara:strand:- start:9878 stop:10051 length:174 start_codon:yes stop_codon:yes gene_type:complete